MLQQTRVAAVIPYYERFLERFPTVHALASAPEQEVLRMWSGLGYYNRARNLQQAAKQIIVRHDGEFPGTKREAIELAGIGEYTAAAILSIAFGKKLAVLDGNVRRVIARLDALRGDLRGPVSWRLLQNRADELLPDEAPGDWNQAMMELGATLCTPRSPQCLLCPVQRFCEARKLGIAEALPEKRKERSEVSVRLATAVLLDQSGNSLLLEPPAGSQKAVGHDHVPSLVAKLWHFPTIPANQDGATALRQMLARQFKLKNLAKMEWQPLSKVRHTVTYRNIEVVPFLVRVQKLPRISGARVIGLSEIDREPISNLTRKVAQAALKQIAGDSPMPAGY